jgi:sorbitol-specific phosphotransferase system component IIC
MVGTRKQAYACVALAFFLELLVPAFYSVSISFFIPPLAMLLYRVPPLVFSWITVIVGLWLDIVQNSCRFGFLGASYLLSGWVISSMRRWLVQDMPATFLLITYFFAGVLAFFQGILAGVLTGIFPRSWSSWFCSECLVMPLVDVVYALGCFWLPLHLWRYYRRHWHRRRVAAEEEQEV